MPDQTNAEVSDERLRTVKPSSARDKIEDAMTHDEALTLISDIATTTAIKHHEEGRYTLGRKIDDALELLNRRSVTSQASEGAEVAWHSRETPTPLDQWIWVSDGVVTWILRGDGKPFDERATACKYWALAGMPFRLPNGEIVTVFEDEPVTAPVSKRVERLETALSELEAANDALTATRSTATYLSMIDNDKATPALERLDAARKFARQALQGGRS